MSGIRGRRKLDQAIDDFRSERVWLIRERGEQAAEGITSEAVNFLTVLAMHARWEREGGPEKPRRRIVLRARLRSACDTGETS